MADLKRWFKVWTSLLTDMDNRSAEDIGHWTRLGCRIALVGHHGSVTFEGGLEHAARFFGVQVEVVKALLDRLPGVSFEEGKNRHGDLTVTMKNWKKYQEDSTQAQRQKASRSKRRGEEIRGDETRQDVAPVVPHGGPERSILEFLNQKADKNFRPKAINLGLIKARLADGITEIQLRAIISRKVHEWRNTEQEKYLRPATLFNKTKCEQYIGELPAPGGQP